ncbi:MAG: PD-(D/E)XK nuclease family protein [Actinobacteria bacterium]|nr:PD-(D/E)XK nuclease family protein [Actinomycetota bacterium]
MLRIVHSVNGSAAWDAALDGWRADDGSKLIVAGPLARHRVLVREVSERGTLLGGVVDTQERLWRDVGSRAEVPAPLDDVELRAAVVDALRDPSIPPRLAAVANHAGDIDRLVAHLKHLDDWVHDDYPAQTPIEGGIADLRQLLADRGVVSRARFRVLAAQAAVGVAYGQGLHVVPPSAIRPTTGMFLQALARGTNVTLYLAVLPADLEPLLAQLGVDMQAGQADGSIEVMEQITTAPPAPVRLVEADDEIEVAVEQAATWGEGGVPLDDIAICVASNDDADGAIQAAARRGLPVVAGRGAAMRDSLVGAILERITLTLDAAADMPRLRDDLIADLAESPDADALGLGPDDIVAIEAARATGTLDEAEALHTLGLRLAEHAYQHAGGTIEVLGPQLQQAYLWLDALRVQLATLRAHGVDAAPRAHLILEQSVAVPRPRGTTGGVAIIRPHEAASLGVRHVIITGLSAGQLPAPPPASPFASRALLDAQPLLRPRDEHTDFSAARAMASSALTLVRQPQGADGIERDPSPWFLEAAEGEVAEGQQPEQVSARDGRAPRRILQARARAGLTDAPAVAQALEALDRHRRDPEFPGSTREQISVTTLEEYLRCPLGWMVGRHMRPWSRGGTNMHMGNVADNAMTAAMNLGGDRPVQVAPVDERIHHAVASLAADPEMALVPRDRRAMLAQWTEATCAKYFDPDYMNTIAPGWRPIAAQVRLRSTTIVDGFTITGVADRVDLTDWGVLVIDWKLQRTIQIPDDPKRRDELQKGLYPLMAAGSPDLGLPREILGFLYVSIAHQDHVGSTVREVGGGGAVDDQWQADTARAKERAALACHGIRDQQVWDTGEYCDAPWCGHSLISTTGRGGL